MERLLNFEDITLIPSEKNNGVDKCDFYVLDELDRSRSLPIFTSPMDSVVSESNWKVWADSGIKPILPRTTPLDIRLEGCQYIFAAFSLIEVQENFLRTKRNSSHQFKICIDPGNGQDTKIFEIGKRLKAMYGVQVNLMGGNMGNPKTYGEYCKTQFDYVRVGIGGSLVSSSSHGFEYPQASLIIDTLGVKNTSLAGVKHTKIISDGYISGPVDILKAIALGADYVMIGREFVRLLEAAGPIFRKGDNGKLVPVDINKESLSIDELKSSNLMRVYAGNTSPDIQKKRNSFEDIHDWVGVPGMKQNMCDSRVDKIRVTGTLNNWLRELYQCLYYGFTMCNSTTWETFKGNVRYGKISR